MRSPRIISKLIKSYAPTTQTSRSYSTSKSQVALCLPGQGFQSSGMLADFQKQYSSIVDPLLQEVDETLQFSLSKYLLSPDIDTQTINLTSNAQPLLLTTSYTIYKILAELGLIGPGSANEIKYVFGHSLGEYSAWTISGVLSLSDAVWLVRQRGKVMERATIECPEPTAMTAILIPKGQYKDIYPLIQRVVAKKPETISIANINATSQTVVSGRKRDVDQLVMDLSDAMGKRMRTRSLAVSGAFHSPLMASGKSAMQDLVDGRTGRSISFNWPPVNGTSIISNITARAFQSLEEVKHSVVNTLTTPVDWLGSIQYISSKPDLKGLICLGPGRVARTAQDDCSLPVLYVDKVSSLGGKSLRFD